MAEPRILSSTDLDDDVRIGDGSSIWHLTQVRDGTEVGENVIVERGTYIGSGVHAGDNCKIQNYALVYEPIHLEDGVFAGPVVVFANDTFPRAVNPDGTSKGTHDQESVGVALKRGSSMGVCAVYVAPVTIGEQAAVAAGFVVTRDVPAHALVTGVPARHIRWVGRFGFPLEEAGPNTFCDPYTGGELEQVGKILNPVKETR